MVAFSEKKLSRRPRIKHMRMWNETLEVHYRSRNIWCGKRSRQSTTCHQRLSSCFETEKSTIFSVDWIPQMTVWKINWFETKFTVKRPGQRDNRVSLHEKKAVNKISVAPLSWKENEKDQPRWARRLRAKYNENVTASSFPIRKKRANGE